MEHSISPLLLRLLAPDAGQNVQAHEVAAALSLVFSDNVSPVQLGLLLWALHVSEGDHDPKVLAHCAQVMRDAAAQVDQTALTEAVRQHGLAEGDYHGGLCDIVGTGGDGHDTFNVSTSASIIASAQLLVAKHGNNSSTSRSGSADLLLHAGWPHAPDLAATTAQSLPDMYAHTRYAFLHAPRWHPGMRYAAPVRRQVPVRTIFNLLGPLAHPAHNSGLLETRVIGVARKDLGPDFAEALRLGGVAKGLVVCGDEDLDEVSCAGPTHCWLLRRRSGEDDGEVEVVVFTVTPEDMGMPRYALSEVRGGGDPDANAKVLGQLLRGELPRDDAVRAFVLLNVATLLVASGICEAETSAMGEGDDGQVVQERGPGGLRWKEGMRRAQWCLDSGEAWRQWGKWVEATHGG